MIDREKVIKGLECCVNDKPFYHAHCTECPYNGLIADSLGGCTKLYCDALALLKEQEPKHGRWVRLTGMAPPEYHGHKICSLCESMAPHHPLHIAQEMLTPYCPGCGAKMEGAAE